MPLASTTFSIMSTDRSSHPDGNSSQPTSFNEVRIMSADLSSCRSWQRNVFSSLECALCVLYALLLLVLVFSDPLVVVWLAAVEASASVAISLDCLSWHSLIDDSMSPSRLRSQSTVRLSTVSVLGCSLLPSESSLRVWSNWMRTGDGGEDLGIFYN